MYVLSRKQEDLLHDTCRLHAVCSEHFVGVHIVLLVLMVTHFILGMQKAKNRLERGQEIDDEESGKWCQKC